MVLIDRLAAAQDVPIWSLRRCTDAWLMSAAPTLPSAILPDVTALSAILAVATAASAILSVVAAPLASLALVTDESVIDSEFTELAPANAASCAYMAPGAGVMRWRGTSVV